MPNAEQTKGKRKATKAKESAEVGKEIETAEGAEAGATGGAVSTADELEEEVTTEQEQTQSKSIKTRSRFSNAFRSLSKSKGKRDKEKEKEKEKLDHVHSEEQLVISGAEDVTSIGDISTDGGLKGARTKKKSLTSRLLLGSLRKSKVRPHSIATSDELSVLSNSSSRERLGVDTTTSLPSPTGSINSSSTLQITISGKKVETLKGKGKPKGKSETDYLQPTPRATATPATSGKTATGSGKTSTTTKLIVAKVAKEPAGKSSKKKQQQQQQLQQKATAIDLKTSVLPTTTETVSLSTPPPPPPLLEEKIVITESRRDTPPRERAPAKPSRVGSIPIQSVSGSGAVRKSFKERHYMQEQEQQQRGHRLNRSTHLKYATTEQPVITVTALETPKLQILPPAPPPTPPALPALPPPSLLPTASNTSTIVLVSLSDVEEQEQTDDVSLAESAGSPLPAAFPGIPQVRFAVGSAVRGPSPDAYEAALAAAASQQPSSSEEPSDSSLRRLSFAQQQFAFSDHDSIEGRRETVRYQSVASEYNDDSQSEDDGEEEYKKKDSKGKDNKHMPAFGDLTMEQQMEPTIMAPSSEKREHLYKILVIGELGTGKTSFIKRYVHQFFSQNYRATIGVDFALKVLHWDANTIVRLQLWDIAGQERFGNMTRVYYKEAVGAFIVFDVTRSGTFDCVSKWKEDLDSKVQLPDGSPIPCILLANKCDQEKQGIVTQPERMDEYVRENGFAGWFETSAKENINIDEAARALVNKILINDKLITADANDEEKFNLSNAGDAGTEGGKNKCSC